MQAVITAAATGAALGPVLVGVAARLAASGDGRDGVDAAGLVRPAQVVATALTTAAAFALLTRRFEGEAALLALLVFASGCVTLSLVDLRVHRLPDVLTLPLAVAVLLLLTAAAWGTGAWGPLGRAAAAMVVLFVLHLALALRPGGGLGFGDVKFAAAVGLVLGWVGWSAVWTGTLLATVLGSLAALVVAARRRTGWTTTVAYGPAMAAGAVLAAGLS